MVEVLNNFFQSVFTQEDPLSVPILTPRVSCSLSEDVGGLSVSEEEVYTVYEQLSR